MTHFQPWISALLITTVISDSTALNNACQNYSTLSDPWRNIGFTSSSYTGGPKNDLKLSSGWYKISGIGGDIVVYNCPNSSASNPTILWTNNSTSTGFQLYTCDELDYSTGVMCAQPNISTQDCGGGLILYYLTSTNGVYNTRHSSCSNTSCGDHAQCGLPYGSCECNPGLFLHAGVLPTGSSYGCTDLPSLPDQCLDSVTVQCLDQIISQIKNSSSLVIPKVIISSTLNTVLNSTNILANISSNQSQLVYYGNSILNATETLVSALVRKTDVDYTDNITLPSLEAAVFVLCLNSSLTKIPQLNTSNASLEIDLVQIWKQNNGINSVAFLSYSNMSGFLKPTLFNTNGSINTMLSTIVSIKLMGTNDQLQPDKSSKAISRSLADSSNGNNEQNLNITLEHTLPMENGSTLHCVYWTYTKWEAGYCHVIQTSLNHTTCFCIRPGTFALIMQTSNSNADSPEFDMLYTIAISVGLVFLILALLTFAFCPRDMTVINAALINLCLSLFLCQLLFLLTQKFLLEIFLNLGQIWCAVIAGVLHFLFLSAFVWMFIEALLLFIFVKNLTKIRSKQEEMLNWKYLVVIGYIIPLVVVGVSAGLFPEGYGSENCWLKADEGFIWSFLGPVCFILGSNMILFIAICLLMYSALKKLDNEILQMKVTRRDENLIKSVMLKTLVQFVIIGCSWILGFFKDSSNVVYILFLAINSQQGTAIFFIHCVFNKEIRDQYKTFLYRCCFSSKTDQKQPRTMTEDVSQSYH
ncbi:adhesion G protein-coupled receptor E3-like [Hoplias malabaricus]|uniref:adhesion G protein-coupled receptor E3-like n=1 Tax=Hoplias malabaricus TaxID=27720 RepID=UPI0034630ADB